MSSDKGLGLGLPKDVLDTAVDWLVKADEGLPDPVFQARLQQWLDEDVLHQWAFDEMQALWQAIDRVPE